MNLNEWALVLFTVTVQMAVGAFLVLGFLHFYAMRKAGLEEADRLSDRALYAIGPVVVFGILASLLHLGNPFGAYRAILNVDSSWLSREIIFTILFAGLGALFAFMQWRKISTFSVRMIVALITAAVGVVLVYSMAQIYMLSIQPAWNVFTTPLFFFATSLLLGSLAVGSALVANYAYVRRTTPDCEEAQCTLLRGSLRWISLVAITLLGINFVALPLYLAYLGAAGGASAGAVALYFYEYPVVLALRLLLAFLGAGVLAVFLYQSATTPGRENVLGVLTYSAFALVLAAELMGRFLFYATQVQIGV
ncbi:MAG TPA: DmsC/YnfH family molybdoenzyme membrane anchor subunit [Anaerolineales bacterium]|nr:DmsC/YnfH family molybdoenzyme membrane anchor subunit [Anaerolineales bacterium]